MLFEYKELPGNSSEPPVLTLTEKNGFVLQSDRFNKRLATNDVSKYKVVRRNDVAFNPYLLWAGAIAQNTIVDKGIISPLYPTFKVRDGFDPRYVARLLLSPQMVASYDTIAFGSVPRRRRSSVSDFLALQISDQPPLHEQRRVAAMLDQADSLRSKLRRCLAHFNQLTQSLFHDAFGDPVANNHDLPVKCLQDWIDPNRPITYGILKPGPEVEEGIPYIRVADMKNGGIDEETVRKTSHEISDQYRRSILQAGDLLMSIRGHVGRFAFIPESLAGSNITQDSARLAITEPASATYVRAAMEMPSFQHWMARRTKGAAVQGINLGDLRQAPIPLPSFEQQQIFAAMLREVRVNASSVERQLWLADGAFASLQSRAFRGEL
ncbi:MULTISPECIES: restriction endonuclease subunit S [Mycobacteriaceae]|uniref:restriction endonuclease subunit S n=1 Tax=Mycobacteriaceae TaxID=1762 RepID=UPI001BB37141|nr:MULTISPECIES: restriction endonuclease subunit S [unclassified Mycolicibacterium]